MARTLAQINQQIESLQKEADQVRAGEVAGVVERIKVAISSYGLTPQDLFGTTGKAATKVKKTRPKTGVKVKKSPAPVKYRDKETGKTWTGNGKRPGWFVKASEGGMKAEDMAV